MKNKKDKIHLSHSRFSPFLLFIILLTISCKKFVEIDPPLNQIASELVFLDDRTATNTVIGLYSRMMQANLTLINGSTSIYGSLTADDIYNTAPNTNYDAFLKNSIPTNLGVLQSNLWGLGYSYIYQANACVEGLNQTTKVSLSVKNQLLGEAKFIRALNYFYLVNIFGDVPLVLSTDYRINETLPRTASDEVYIQIIKDLSDAKTLLLPSYPSAGYVRANKWAATALLAKVFLYQKNWVNAESNASEIINSGAYSLLTNLNAVFLADSKEAILQLIPTSSTNTAEGFTFIPASATVIPTFAITNTLLFSFENTDKRKLNWLSKNTISGAEYYFPAKYKVRTNIIKTEYNMLFRLAEQYLIRAEARAQQDKITGVNGAENDINQIRSRAGLLPSVASNKSEMLLAIEKENQLEFFTECGHRWFDIKRTGRIDNILMVSKTSWTSTSSLYPVPFLEMQRNPTLTQNPGYQ